MAVQVLQPHLHPTEVYMRTCRPTTIYTTWRPLAVATQWKVVAISLGSAHLSGWFDLVAITLMLFLASRWHLHRMPQDRLPRKATERLRQRRATVMAGQLHPLATLPPATAMLPQHLLMDRTLTTLEVHPTVVPARRMAADPRIPEWIRVPEKWLQPSAATWTLCKPNRINMQISSCYIIRIDLNWWKSVIFCGSPTSEKGH